jgi:Protein of unknown function (DUF1488)/CHAT domain
MDEYRQIDERIRASKNREETSLATKLAIRAVDLTQALLDEQPTVVHFSGHGAAGAICLQSDTGETKVVEPAALASLLSLFSGQIRAVVLNACYSAAQADALVQHVDYVVGMSKAISDSAAIAYSVGFYAALGAGRSIEDAHKFGVAQIGLEGLHEVEVPILTAKSNLGTPTFSEPPTAPPTRDYSNLVLLMARDAGLVILPAVDISVANDIELTVLPEGDRDAAHVKRIRMGMALSIAYGTTALICDVKDVVEKWHDGVQNVTIRGTANLGPYTPFLGEMNGFGYSADELAGLRARRILLDERLQLSTSEDFASTANSTMLEIFVRGLNVPIEVIKSPLPDLYTDLKNDPTFFLAAARLMSVMFLRLSGVVEEVTRLEFQLDGERLQVRFAGRRFKVYSNVDAPRIEVAGFCDLLRAAIESEPHVVSNVMFDGARWWDFDRGGVTFSGEADGKRVLFFVSEEALADHFGAGMGDSSPLAAFDANVIEIQRIGIHLLRIGRMDDERRVFIRTADVSALGRG